MNKYKKISANPDNNGLALILAVIAVENLLQSLQGELGE